VIDALLDLPAHSRKRLSSAIESGALCTPYSIVALRSVLGPENGTECVCDALKELERIGVQGSLVVAWLHTIEQALTRTALPDLVWSGPEVRGLHARDTRRVFDELLGSAETSIVASTYAFFDGPRAFDVIARRMDSVPAVQTTLLLNIQRKWGDTTSSEQLVRRFADRFWSMEWPGSSRPSVFYDPRALDPEGPSGVLHAKALIVDHKVVLITSANFTEAALDRNIELGVLMRDQALAASIASHFQVLIDSGRLLPLPPS